jgi:acyl carrier protein
MMNIREQIISTFSELLIEEIGQSIELQDSLELLDSGLDSLGLAILIVRLESQIGFDPFTISEIAVYPRTLGEFIKFYEDTQLQFPNGVK